MYIDTTGNVFLSPPYTCEENELALTSDESELCFADYLAPEQALNSYKADQRSDLYSLGCSMFYMLTAMPPFQGQSIADVLLKHQTERPVSPNIINSQVPESLADICLKMMAKKPTDRYQTMLELRTALTIWLNE